MDVYGIGNNNSNEITHKGFSREEAYAYIECEGVSGDTIIRKHEGVWYSLASDKTWTES